MVTAKVCKYIGTHPYVHGHNRCVTTCWPRRPPPSPEPAGPEKGLDNKITSLYYSDIVSSGRFTIIQIDLNAPFDLTRVYVHIFMTSKFMSLLQQISLIIFYVYKMHQIK